MKKLGIGKKDNSDDTEEAKRSHLFGKSSKSKSPAPSANPYAAAQNNSSADPYVKPAPYTSPSGVGKPAYGDASRSSTVSQPPAYQPGNFSNGMVSDSARQGKSPVPPGRYGSGPRYGNNGYGNQGGYGNERFGGAGNSSSSSSRPGGYGGLGEPDVDEANRNALFGGAKQRFEEKQAQQAQQSSLLPEDSQPGGGYGMDEQGYGGYQDRQLTVCTTRVRLRKHYTDSSNQAEEEEEEDVDATKQEIKAMKQRTIPRCSKIANIC